MAEVVQSLTDLPRLLGDAVEHIHAEMSDADRAAGRQIFEGMCDANPMPTDKAGIARLTLAALTYALGAVPHYLGTQAQRG